MDLLILDGPQDSRGPFGAPYRGTDRRWPTYCDEAGQTDEVNELFTWFLGEGGQSGVVHNLAKAQRYAALCTAQLHRPFEVVEVTLGGARPEIGRLLLGYDLLMSFSTSLISAGLAMSGNGGGLPPPIEVLQEFLSHTFRPQLNVYGLFSSYDVAERCLSVMNALQVLRPNLYEGTHDLSDSRVTGVYEIG